MNKKIILFLGVLLSFVFYSCSSNSAFDIEDEMMGGDKELLESPIGVFWTSFETTSIKAKKKSEELIPQYYSLFYIPKNNELHITSIAENQTVELNIEDARKPGEVILVSEFKGINIYRLFFKDKRSPKLEKLIKKKSKKIKHAEIPPIKVTEDPEIMMKKLMLEKIKKDLSNKLKTKFIDKDYEVTANFVILKVYNFRYKNIQKTIEFKFDYLFTNFKLARPDYAGNLGAIEDSIASNMENGNFKEAQKFNEIYKKIVPDKNKYYENAFKINMKLGDKMAAVLTLIEQIEVMDNIETDKTNVKKIRNIFKNSLKRKDWNLFNRKLYKSYKKYLRGKLKKEGFVETLKNLVIEYSLD